MTRLRYDFQQGTLSSSLSDVATSMSSAALAALPAVTAPDYLALVLDPTASAGNPEVVYVTAHTGGATTATITRAQEGTVARAHASPIAWRHVPTATDYVGRSGVQDTITAQAIIEPASDVATGIVFKRFSDTQGELGGNDYGEGQFIIGFKEGTGDPADLVLFRIGADGSMGTAGNFHLNTGRNQTGAGATSFGKMFWIDPEVNITGNIIQIDAHSTQTGGFLGIYDSDGDLRLNYSATHVLNFLEETGTSVYASIAGPATPPSGYRAFLLSGTAGTVALGLKSAASQSDNVFESITSADVVRMAISSTHALNFNNNDASAIMAQIASGTTTPNGIRATFLTGSAAEIGVLIKGATSQTGDLWRTTDVSNNVLLAVTAAGLPQWKATANQQTTVGAAGAASALPATPTKYLKVVDSGGTTLVIPAYLAS